MNWVVLDEARARSDMPTDLTPFYDAWLVENPGKAGRLAAIVSAVVAEFRDAIASNAANRLDPRTDALPESCIRSAEVLIYGSLQNEMGRKLSGDDAQAMTRAEILLRQIGYGHFVTGAGDATSEPSPHCTVDVPRTERILP